MKGIFRELTETLIYAGKLQIKDLLPHRIFLVYCTKTYRVLNPHLKELHLILVSLMLYIDSVGWKLQGKELLEAIYDRKMMDLERRRRTIIFDISTAV